MISISSFCSETVLSLCLLGLASLSLYKIFGLFKAFELQKPVNVPIYGLPTVFGKLTSGVINTLWNPEMIMKGYRDSNGQPFALPTLTNYHVYVTDEKLVHELATASEEFLNLDAALDDLIRPDLIGIRDEAYYDPHNTISRAIMGKYLRLNLSKMRVELAGILQSSFEQDLKEDSRLGGSLAISAGSFGKRVFGLLGCRTILGKRLTDDPKVQEAALRFPQDLWINYHLFGILPTPLHRLAAAAVFWWSGSSERLGTSVSQHLKERISKPPGGKDDPESMDCIEFMLDYLGMLSGRENISISGTTHRCQGFLFGVAFQPPMFASFLIYNLCKYPKYQSLLHDELESASIEDLWGSQKTQTPRLDSFLRETARLYPLQTITSIRKAIKPFTFSNGVHVPAGNFICVPQHAFMQDRTRYPDSSSFNPYRWLNGNKDSWTTTSRFSHPDQAYTFWGPVPHACPGRFYVSMTMKMLMVHVINNYTVAFGHEPTKPYVSMAQAMLPNPKMVFLFKHRGEKQMARNST